MINFKKLTNEIEELIEFMISNEWPYHSDGKPEREKIILNFEKGWYFDDRETFWIEMNNEKVGLLIIHDIGDTIPLFDLRLSEKVRGQGVGTKTLMWLKDYLFSHPDKKIRIEAYTRSDNYLMRKAFFKAGFVKEGYLRQAWENADGTVSDSVFYAVIRSDWENGIITPILLNEVPF